MNCCFCLYGNIFMLKKSADCVRAAAAATATAASSTRWEEYKPEKVEQLAERSAWLPACARSLLCDCGRRQMRQRDVGYGERLSRSWSRSHAWERSIDENEWIPSQFFPRLSKQSHDSWALETVLSPEMWRKDGFKLKVVCVCSLILKSSFNFKNNVFSFQQRINFHLWKVKMCRC